MSKSIPQSIRQRQEVNLFTLEFRRADQPISFSAICRYCLVLFAALMLIESYTAWALFSQQDSKAQLNAEKQLVSARLNTLKQAQPLSQRPKLEANLATLQQQVQQRKELQRIMGGQEFGNFDGFSPFIVGLARQANRDVSLTHIHLLEGGSILRLQGWARIPEAVPKYLQDLRFEPSLEDVRFGVLLIEKDPKHSHKLKFTLGEESKGST